MKRIILILVVILTTSVTYTQEAINASVIINAIKSGENINYSNKIIIGPLDFTFMENTLKENPKKKKKSSWWNKKYNSYNTVNNNINVPISFTNCTFKDDVLAYIPDENSGYTFIANFEDSVVFSNCNFERKAMFKYSNFEGDTDFSGAIFSDDTTFKYAKFEREISFENTKFTEVSTFKYAKFKRNVSFASAVFEDSAIFKYTEFKNGVSFKNANFKEDLDIKYMNVSGEFTISNMNVGNDIDSKYTKINGKSFSKYLINIKS